MQTHDPTQNNGFVKIQPVPDPITSQPGKIRVGSDGSDGSDGSTVFLYTPRNLSMLHGYGYGYRIGYGTGTAIRHFSKIPDTDTAIIYIIFYYFNYVMVFRLIIIIT